MTSRTLVGSSFAGYRIERILGRGGMSVVYLAEHPRLQNLVALKLLAPALAEDEIFRERLVRESRLAAALNHPNVIPVYDTGEEDGALFVSMRYVAGSDLRALLKERKRLPPAETAAIVSQAASALDAAHARGLVHRDVKPANILVEPGGDPPGHVYVADFGLTRHTDARSGATASGVVGTVDYMAPEQIEGRQPVPGTDVYALGCLLYECLVGRPPFPRESDVAVLWAHIRELPPLPGEADAALHAFDGIVERALAKAPAERYESCGALAADVRTAAGAARPRRARKTRLPRARSRSRRAWVVPTLLGVVAGAAVAAGVALGVSGGGHPVTGSRVGAAPSPTLLAVVPTELRTSCTSAQPPSPDFDVSVICHPRDPTVGSVQYSHAVSGLRMRQRLITTAWSVDVAQPGHAVRPVGTCSKGGAAVRDWAQLPSGRRTEVHGTPPGPVGGRLLCYTSGRGWSAIEWTDLDYDVYSVAFGRSRYGLYRWWRVRGGPAA
ncbi:MAG TPA: serine/threonine-protein kinase [Gaiellaceae bacterium]